MKYCWTDGCGNDSPLEGCMTPFVITLLLLSMPGAAMPQAPAASHTEMRKLDFLVGKWQGEGWIEMAPEQRRTFKQTETVQSKLDGTILTVDGLGKGKRQGNDEETVVHNAFAVISYNEQTGKFRWHGYQSGGLFVDAEATVTENSLIWSFPSPRGGKVRFTISQQAKGKWREIGEFSMDGGTWKQFFEMILERVQ